MRGFVNRIFLKPPTAESLTVVEPNRSDESSAFLDIALKKIDSQFPFSNLNKKTLFPELYSR